MLTQFQSMSPGQILAMILALLYTIVSHELGHALVAYWNGDATAKEAGRLTINPLPHISWPGLLSLVLFRFGWAKPVPINPYRFRSRRLGLLTTSLAGIMVNLLSALLALFLWNQFFARHAILGDLFLQISIYGVSFGLFNLIPIPPLDGSKIVMSLLPDALTTFVEHHEQVFHMLLLILVFSGLLSDILLPAMDSVFNWMIRIVVG